VGPITFISLGEYGRAPPSNFAPVRPALLREPWIRGRADALVREEVREASLYVAHKVLVVIEGGSDVTVLIPESERNHASLLWGPTPGVTRSRGGSGSRRSPTATPPCGSRAAMGGSWSTSGEAS
jgi:hypothetical protein